MVLHMLNNIENIIRLELTIRMIKREALVHRDTSLGTELL